MNMFVQFLGPVQKEQDRRCTGSFIAIVDVFTTIRLLLWL